MTSHAIPFSQHHPHRNKRESRPQPTPRPPTYAAITAYARTIGWEITRDQIATFIQFYHLRAPSVWKLARRWQASVRIWHRDMPRPVTPPSRLARAVDLALDCPP